MARLNALYFAHNLNMDKEILRYYKKQYKKGSSPLAALIDKVGLRLLVFMAGYFIYFYITKNFLLPFVLSGITTLGASMAISILEQKRFAKFAERYSRTMREHIILENLLMYGKQKRNEFFKKIIEKKYSRETYPVKCGFCSNDTLFYIFENHPSHQINAQDMLICYDEMQKTGKKNCVCFAFSDYKKEAVDFIKIAEWLSFTLVDAAGIIDMAGDLKKIISEEELTDIIKKRIRSEKITMSAIRAEALKSTKFKAYLITGIIFGVLAFVFTFPIYLLSMSAVCIVLGTLTCFSEPQNK